MRKLIIPEKVKIKNVEYTVYPDADLIIIDNRVDFAGSIEPEECTISILNTLPYQRKLEVFFHELVHGIFIESGYDKHDEEMIDRLSSTLLQVLRDNEFYE